jgi:sterol desaturase/sphingolipid hydroxylase (fatty acid hydroxylase superfamily)
MGLLSLEHGRFAYRADFVLYGVVIAALAVDLVLRTTSGPSWGSAAWELGAWVVGGLLAWTLIEYLVHRFVLHGLRPFKGWHAAHHRDTSALIGLPTVFSAALFAGLVAAPAWWLLGADRAQAFTLGVLAGYLMYAVVHHLAHHTWPPAPAGSGAVGTRRATGAAPARLSSPGLPSPSISAHTTVPAHWLRQRRRIHALHHGPNQGTAGFGVTSDVWDRLLGSHVTGGVRLVRR